MISCINILPISLLSRCALAPTTLYSKDPSAVNPIQMVRYNAINAPRSSIPRYASLATETCQMVI